jgi:uncharacterized peroxidase-related enzyme
LKIVLCRKYFIHLKFNIMTRLQALNPELSEGKTKDLFNAVQTKLGMVPNMVRTMGNSYAVLNGYLAFSGALGESEVGAKLGEQIALAVAETNQCEYCLSAHTLIGGDLLGIDESTISASRTGNTGNAKVNAALAFAQTLVNKKGLVNDDDVAVVRKAGYTDAGIAEIIAHTALNTFTNYFNNVANTVIDFPRVSVLKANAA